MHETGALVPLCVFRPQGKREADGPGRKQKLPQCSTTKQHDFPLRSDFYSGTQLKSKIHTMRLKVSVGYSRSAAALSSLSAMFPSFAMSALSPMTSSSDHVVEAFMRSIIKKKLLYGPLSAPRLSISPRCRRPTTACVVELLSSSSA